MTNAERNQRQETGEEGFEYEMDSNMRLAKIEELTDDLVESVIESSIQDKQVTGDGSEEDNAKLRELAVAFKIPANTPFLNLDTFRIAATLIVKSGIIPIQVDQDWKPEAVQVVEPETESESPVPELKKESKSPKKKAEKILIGVDTKTGKGIYTTQSKIKLKEKPKADSPEAKVEADEDKESISRREIKLKDHLKNIKRLMDKGVTKVENGNIGFLYRMLENNREEIPLEIAAWCFKTLNRTYLDSKDKDATQKLADLWNKFGGFYREYVDDKEKAAGAPKPEEKKEKGPKTIKQIINGYDFKAMLNLVEQKGVSPDGFSPNELADLRRKAKKYNQLKLEAAVLLRQHEHFTKVLSSTKNEGEKKAIRTLLPKIEKRGKHVMRREKMADRKLPLPELLKLIDEEEEEIKGQIKKTKETAKTDELKQILEQLASSRARVQKQIAEGGTLAADSAVEVPDSVDPMNGDVENEQTEKRIRESAEKQWDLVVADFESAKPGYKESDEYKDILTKKEEMIQALTAQFKKKYDRA